MSQSHVELIKERLSITEVVSGYIELQAAGRSLKGKCPFHREKTPSFFVSPERGTYYCFGCGVKGDIFSFVQEYEKVDFPGALKMLAERTGVDLGQLKREAQERNPLREIMEEVVKYFQENLKKDSVGAEKARAYLQGRGLEQKTIEEWQIGLSLNEWHGAEEYLTKKGYSRSDIEKAGIIKQGEKGIYDRFRDRIMFPIYDVSGRPIAFTGRVMPGNDAEAKYLNSPDTPLFNKSEVLYGFHIAKHVIREKKYSILVEGQMDLLMAHQAGFKNVVATSGTALTLSQLEMMRRMSPNIMLVYDADNAGINATMKAWLLAQQARMEVKVALLPKEKDPADVIKEDVESFKAALKNAKPVMSYIMGVVSSDQVLMADPREKAKAIREKILPYIKSIKSPLDRSRFLREAEMLFDIRESVLQEELDSVKAVEIGGDMSSALSKNVSIVSATNKSTRAERALRLLFGLVLRDSPVSDVIKKKLSDIPGFSFEDRKAKFEEIKDILLFELDNIQNDIQSEKTLNELLFYAEEGILEERFESLMVDVSKAEKAGDLEKVSRFLEECKLITNRIAQLAASFNNT